MALNEAFLPDKIRLLLEKSEKLNKISGADLSAEEKEGIEEGWVDRFGNNFWLLFEGLRTKGEMQSPFVTMKLEQAEALGALWESFLSQNQELLSKIKVALAEQATCDALMDIYCKLSEIQEIELKEDLERARDPEIGLGAILIPVVRKTNGLLEEVAEAMRKLNIDPTQFFS